MTTKSAGGFARALTQVLVHEGGKVDHPKDPGGRTNKGITQRVYNGWRTKQNLPARDVYLIGDAEVEAIYRFQYWEPIMGEQLPEGVAYVVFDGAVNSGPGQSIKWLQRALGPLYAAGVDGDMGAGTLGAVKAVNDNDALIGRIIDRRETFLRALKTWATFGKGWMKRINQVEKTGQAWATGSVGPVPEFFEGGNAKANLDDAKQAPGKGLADAGVGVGGATGIGGPVAIDQAKEALAPWASSSKWISVAIAVLVISGALIAGGSFAYRWYAARKRIELADALDLQPVSA